MKEINSLTSCRLVNFKAIRTTGRLKLTPLTVFVGNNGSGKSSVVEALQTLQVLVEKGVDEAMQLWRGVEHAYHKAAPTLSEGQKPLGSVRDWGMSFSIAGQRQGDRFQARLELIPSSNRDVIAAFREECLLKGRKYRKPEAGWDRKSFVPRLLRDLGLTRRWQFLHLVPQHMMSPVPIKATPGGVRLSEDGRNIAEYLDEIRKLDVGVYDGIMESLRFVIPYMREVRSESASLVEKTVYLTLVEPGLTRNNPSGSNLRQQVPGWMISTGTLRVLAIIACLRHPNPPTLLVIEEIENGLDPRTLGFVMDEIRRAVKSRRTQVILTTHSAQLLETVLLEHLVFVQRNDAGEPKFIRPAEVAEVQKWAVEYSASQMFSRGLFRQLI